ncbi:MAG: hypothetical protein ACRC1M_00540 [Methanobacteriaceae archaeon]
MNSKVVIVAIIAILVIGVGAYAYYTTTSNNGGNNITNETNITNNSTNNGSNANNTVTGNVTAKLSGPAEAAKGDSVDLTWTVTNNMNTAISSVKGTDQNANYNFGTIAPGETKTFTFKVKIPTDDEVKADFGGGSVSNPFGIGGFALSWDVNGETKNINSNSIEIKLI